MGCGSSVPVAAAVLPLPSPPPPSPPDTTTDLLAAPAVDVPSPIDLLPEIISPTAADAALGKRERISSESVLAAKKPRRSSSKTFQFKNIAFPTLDNAALLRRHLTPEVFEQLRYRRSLTRMMLGDCLDVPPKGSKGPGLVAADASCFDTFCSLFRAVVKDLYQADALSHCPAAPTQVDGAPVPVAAVEVHFTRNVDGGHVFPGLLGPGAALATVEAEVCAAVARIAMQHNLGLYTPLDSLRSDVLSMVRRRFPALPPDALLSGGGHRGMYATTDRTLVVLVNCLDHVRVMAAGVDIRTAWNSAVALLRDLGQTLSWAVSPHFGLLARHLDHLGNGCELHVRVAAPAVLQHLEWPVVAELWADNGVEVTGAYSAAAAGVGGKISVACVPSLRLSASQAVQAVIYAVTQLIRREVWLEAGNADFAEFCEVDVPAQPNLVEAKAGDGCQLPITTEHIKAEGADAELAALEYVSDVPTTHVGGGATADGDIDTHSKETFPATHTSIGVIDNDDTTANTASLRPLPQCSAEVDGVGSNGVFTRPPDGSEAAPVTPLSRPETADACKDVDEPVVINNCAAGDDASAAGLAADDTAADDTAADDAATTIGLTAAAAATDDAAAANDLAANGLVGDDVASSRSGAVALPSTLEVHPADHDDKGLSMPQKELSVVEVSDACVPHASVADCGTELDADFGAKVGAVEAEASASTMPQVSSANGGPDAELDVPPFYVADTSAMSAENDIENDVAVTAHHVSSHVNSVAAVTVGGNESAPDIDEGAVHAPPVDCGGATAPDDDAHSRTHSSVVRAHALDYSDDHVAVGLTGSGAVAPSSDVHASGSTEFRESTVL